MPVRGIGFTETPKMLRATGGGNVWIMGCWRDAGTWRSCIFQNDLFSPVLDEPKPVDDLVDVTLLEPSYGGLMWFFYRAPDGTASAYQRNGDYGGIGAPQASWIGCGTETPNILRLAGSGAGALAVVDLGGPQPEIRRLRWNVGTGHDCSLTPDWRAQQMRESMSFVALVARGQTIRGLGTGPNGLLYAYLEQDGKTLIARANGAFATTAAAITTGESDVVDSQQGALLRFTSLGQLHEIRDLRTGALSLSIVRDSVGSLSSTSDAFGNVTQFEHDPFGEIAKITGSYGHQTTLQYDFAHRPTDVLGPEGLHYGLSWQAPIGNSGEGLGILDTFTDPSGNTSHFGYQDGLLIRDTDAAGGVQSLSSSSPASGSRVVVRTDGDAVAHTYRFEGGAGKARRSVAVARKPELNIGSQSWVDLNSDAERFVLSINSECLNHTGPLGKHSRTLVNEFLAHYHFERPHQSLGNGLIRGS